MLTFYVYVSVKFTVTLMFNYININNYCLVTFGLFLVRLKPR